MIIGYFDVSVILVLIILNFILWRKTISVTKSCLFGFLIFGIVLPLISIAIEFENNSEENAEVFDAFTMLYTLFKFPLYWLIFSLQSIILSIKKGNKNI